MEYKYLTISSKIEVIYTKNMDTSVALEEYDVPVPSLILNFCTVAPSGVQLT
jgi:hypothetical protein